MKSLKLLYPSIFLHLQLWIYFLAFQICCFWTCHVNRIIQYVVSFLRLLSFSIMFLGLIHDVSCLSKLLNFCRIVSHCIDIPPFCFFPVYSSVDGHVSCCQFWVIINNVAMNIFVQVFVQIDIFFLSLGLRSGIVGWYDSISYHFEKWPNSFPKWLPCFPSPPAL